MLAASLAGSQAADKKIVVKLSTLVPKGTSYEKILLGMRDQWRQASGGAVDMIIYAGTQGSENEFVGLMQTGNLDAALVSGIGLAEIERSIAGLQFMPLTFRSLAEMDYVAAKVLPMIEERLQAKGYKVLFWGDSGWVRFFTKAPLMRPADLKRMKLFCWAGDTQAFDLYKALDLNPVALEPSDIPSGLTTGMIEAVAMPPFWALAQQLDAKASYMLELNYAPLLGAAVIRTKTWNRIPADLQPALLKAAAEAGKVVQSTGRSESDKAVAAMQKRGLKVQAVTPELEAEWRQLIDTIKDKIRGKIVPEKMYDEVIKYVQEYRAGGSK